MKYVSAAAVLVMEEGVFVECNDATVELLEYDGKEGILGKTPAELSPPFQPDGLASEEKAAALLEEVFRKGRQRRFEWLHRSRTGKGVLVDALLNPIRLEEGTVVYVVWRDISETRALEQRQREQEAMLVQQSKMAAMGEMIAAIAHQWKQPLNALALIVQDLQDAFVYGDMDKPYLDRAVKGAMEQIRYMGETIDDFRNFLKPSREKKVFDLRRAVGEVADLLEPQFGKQKIRVLFETSGEGEYPVEGLPNEFKQVILNLFNNARDVLIQNRPGSGRIVAAFRREGEHCVVTVRDNGGGIPSQVLSTLFEPYVTTKGEQGTGIGLYMARTIVEQGMGGRLTAENGEEGACFTVSLPLAEKG